MERRDEENDEIMLRIGSLSSKIGFRRGRQAPTIPVADSIMGIVRVGVKIPAELLDWRFRVRRFIRSRRTGHVGVTAVESVCDLLPKDSAVDADGECAVSVSIWLLNSGRLKGTYTEPKRNMATIANRCATGR